MQRKYLIYLIVALLFAVPLLTAEVANADNRERVPPAVEEVIGLARSLPAEFAVDVMIRVAELPALRRLKFRRQLLEDAFVLAGRVSESVPRRTLPSIDPNSEEAVLGRAFQLGLDALTLRTRVVAALGDAAYLERLPTMAATATTCDERLIPDPTPYWKLLARLDLAPSGELHSVAEVPSIVEMIMSRKWPAAELERITAWLLLGMERLGGDDRAFTVSLGQVAPALERLAIFRTQNGLEARSVIEGIGRYWVKHLDAPRCEDGEVMVRGQLTGLVFDFNQRMRKAAHLTKDEVPVVREELLQAGNLVRPGLRRTEEEWRTLYSELRDSSDSEAVLTSRLYELKPAVWFLLAEKFISSESSHPVMVTYRKLAALQR